MHNEVKVGVGVFIIKDKQVLLGKRKGAHGNGCWSIPGGKLEFGESLETCAKREVLEETGLDIKNIQQGPSINSFFHEENQHWLSVFMVAEYKAGTPTICEREKCEEWCWFSWNEFPTPLFLPIAQLLQQLSLEAILTNISQIKTH